MKHIQVSIKIYWYKRYFYQCFLENAAAGASKRPSACIWFY